VIGAIILALAASTAPVEQAQCDPGSIAYALKQIDIADYKSSATSPPPLVVAELYSMAAQGVERCAASTHHYMGSRIGDLLQAATYAKFAALAYFDAEQPSQGCSMLAKAGRDSTSAATLSTSADAEDRRRLQAGGPNSASIRQLLATKCQSEPPT
jgi:hypothetical protein